MAMLPFAGAGGSAFLALVGRLVVSAMSVAKGRGAIIGAGGIGTVIADIINLDWLRQQSLQFAGGNSSPGGLEDAAKLAARLLGLDGGSVLWPRRNGQPIEPRYIHINLMTGRAWYSDRYTPARAARSFGARRGFSRGRRAGRTEMVQSAQVGR